MSVAYVLSADNSRKTGAVSMHSVDIAKDFSPTPGGRYERHGEFSGEAFRNNVVAPALKYAISQNAVLNVRIDTVRRSYLVSFLDEAFAGLIRECGFSKKDVQAHLNIIADLPRFAKYKALADYYIDGA